MAETYKLRVKSKGTEIEIEGDKKFVEGHFSQFKKLLKDAKLQSARNARSSKKGRKRGRKKKPGRKPKKEKRVKLDLPNMELKQILEEAKPDKEDTNILVFSYWLNKRMRKREFRSPDIEAMYKEIGMEAPNNITYYLRKLSDEDKGLLQHGRKNGRYKISPDGLKYITYKTIKV